MGLRERADTDVADAQANMCFRIPWDLLNGGAAVIGREEFLPCDVAQVCFTRINPACFDDGLNWILSKIGRFKAKVFHNALDSIDGCFAPSNPGEFLSWIEWISSVKGMEMINDPAVAVVKCIDFRYCPAIVVFDTEVNPL